VKAIIIARSYLQEEQITIAMTPSFLDVVIDGEERTALRMVVERR
jgi:stage V sporulation protein S